MLKERDTSLCDITPTRLASYFFNSFFVFTLMIRDNGYNYSSVKRWTKKIDVFSLDKVSVNIYNYGIYNIFFYMSSFLLLGRLKRYLQN